MDFLLVVPSMSGLGHIEWWIIPYFSLASCVYYSDLLFLPLFSYMIRLVFDNVSDKGRKLVVGDDVCFITGIGGTVARDYCCIEVTIKWCTHHSWLDSLFMLFSDFKAQGLRNIPKPLRTALIEIFHSGIKTNIHPLPVSWYFISCSLW